jgi:hypothetical protein
MQGDMPTEFNRLQRETQDLLEEFQAYNSNINFSFVDPLENEDESMDNIKKLYLKGLTPINITVDDKGKQSQAMVFPWAIALYKNKVPAYSLGGKNFTAVKDVATAMANAITMGKIGNCYILGNFNLTYKESFEKMAAAIGAKAPTRKFSSKLVIAYGTLSSFFASVFKYYPSITKELAVLSSEHHYYSAEKAHKELLMPQTPIETAALECFEWFKENGYLKK